MNGRKCVSLLLALCMALALTSCGAKPGQEPEKDSGPAETETGAETAPETGPETEPDAVAVSTAAELIDYAYGRYNIHAYTVEVYSPGKSENGDISSCKWENTMPEALLSI